MTVEGDSEVTLARVMIARTRGDALDLYDPTTRVSGSDLSLIDLEPDDLGYAGSGIYASSGAFTELSRVRIERAHDVGILALDAETSLTLADLSLVGIESRALDGRFGRGIDVESGAALTVTRGSVDDVRNLGVFVGGADASVVLDDFEVSAIEHERCAEMDSCPEASVGVGLGSYSAATLTVNRFSIADATLCGVQVGNGGEMDVRDGEVRSSTIGACVQVDGYDVGRLTERVRYLDNGSNLDASGALPLPIPFMPGGV
jgi:hypothetical protein